MLKMRLKKNLRITAIKKGAEAPFFEEDVLKIRF